MKRDKLGFTLIEVVIAMAILGFIVTVVYSALSQIIRSARLIDDRRDSGFISNAVLNRVIREIQMTFDQVPLMSEEEESSDKSQQTQRVFVLGKRQELVNGKRGDSIKFVGLEAGQYMPDGQTHAGLVQIGYSVQQDPENNDDKRFVLVREEIPMITPREEALKKKMVFPITKDLVSLELRYFDPEKKEWTDNWGEDSRNSKVPSMVEITVEIISPAGTVEKLRTALAIRTIEQG